MIWSKSKPDVEFQYGGRLGKFHGMSSHSHLPHCRVQSPGEINVALTSGGFRIVSDTLVIIVHLGPWFNPRRRRTGRHELSSFFYPPLPPAPRPI